MSHLSLRRWVSLRRRWESPTIDLGGGHQVAAEDVLEGHFRRLADQSVRVTEVSVQVTPALRSVISVAAPTLAPLTHIAEEIAVKLPAVQPAPGFRSDLHRALEEAHKRRLENPPLPERRHGPVWPAIVVAVVVGLSGAGIALFLWRRHAR